MGELDADHLYTQETIEFDVRLGCAALGVLENFAANILDGTPLLAPGSDGINGVRLANAIHLSSWTGREVPLDFDEDGVPRRAQRAHPRRGQVPRARVERRMSGRLGVAVSSARTDNHTR